MKPSVNHLTTPFRYLKQAKKLTLGSVSKPKLFIANGFLTTGLEKKFHLGVQDEWIFLLGKYRYKCTMYIATFEAHLTNGQGSVFPLQSETTLLTTCNRLKVY